MRHVTYASEHHGPDRVSVMCSLYKSALSVQVRVCALHPATISVLRGNLILVVDVFRVHNKATLSKCIARGRIRDAQERKTHGLAQNACEPKLW